MAEQDKRHPKSTYAAKYPFNKVFVTENGHEFHYDDTPGKERIREAHKSGTYYEISPDGKRTEMVVANKIEYVKGGKTTTVDKNVDVKVGGSSRENVSGDSHTEVKGTSSTQVGGDSKSIVGGDSASAVNGEMMVAARGGFTGKFGGGAESKIDGDVALKVDGTMSIQVGKDVTIESGTKITLKVGGSTVTIESGKITLKSQKVIADGEEVKTVGDTYLGLEDADEKPMVKVITEGGPARKTFSKV